MTHGEITRADWQNIITVRPGPVLHVWRNGSEFCAVHLDHNAALTLIGSLTAAMQVSGQSLPNEGISFDEHLRRRLAERGATT